ncbi:hypothetical protein [Legionella gresilensis]|uniref:hypothetical protein n=1 Tax=Legionella gresilensis TaxID=91823 RepID=UPI001041977F|nr:hypothetical protein [Legionella gresilensis]
MHSPQEIAERNKQIKENLHKMICLSEVEANRAYQAVSRNARFEAGQAALSEETDSKGNKVPYWELIKSKAKEFTTPSGQNSYIEWHTGIMEIFAAMCTLSKASYHSPSLVKEGLTWVGEAVKNKLHKKPSEPIKFDISVDDNGVLKTQLYLNNKLVSPDDPKQEAIKQYFDMGVAAWLEQRGYTVDKDTGVVTNAQTNEKMTTAKFKEVNQDDDEGLKAFFSGTYKLNIDKAPDAPSPRLGG